MKGFKRQQNDQPTVQNLSIQIERNPQDHSKELNCAGNARIGRTPHP